MTSSTSSSSATLSLSVPSSSDSSAPIEGQGFGTAADAPATNTPVSDAPAADTPTADTPTADAPAAATSRGTASRTMSVLALSLGIASFFFAQSIVVPLAAVILGVFGLRDEPTGRGFSIWGIVLACVATFGWVLVVAAGALAVLPFVFLAAAF